MGHLDQIPNPAPPAPVGDLGRPSGFPKPQFPSGCAHVGAGMKTYSIRHPNEKTPECPGGGQSELGQWRMDWKLLEPRAGGAPSAEMGCNRSEKRLGTDQLSDGPARKDRAGGQKSLPPAVILSFPGPLPDSPKKAPTMRQARVPCRTQPRSLS